MGLSKNGLDLQALVTAAITMIWAVQILGLTRFSQRQHLGCFHSSGSSPTPTPSPTPSFPPTQALATSASAPHLLSEPQHVATFSSGQIPPIGLVCMIYESWCYSVCVCIILYIYSYIHCLYVITVVWCVYI